MQIKMTRRALVRHGLAAGALMPLAGLFAGTAAHAQIPPLDSSDPTAKALNYVTKSVKPDKCGNCSQFQGKAGDVTGPCTIFPGKSVESAGWCSGWVKKAT